MLPVSNGSVPDPLEFLEKRVRNAAKSVHIAAKRIWNAARNGPERCQKLENAANRVRNAASFYWQGSRPWERSGPFEESGSLPGRVRSIDPK